MRKQKISIRKINLAVVAILCGLLPLTNLFGQSSDIFSDSDNKSQLKITNTLLTQNFSEGYSVYNNNTSKMYFDLLIPEDIGSYNAIELHARGGDGGNAYNSSVRSYGGEAATTKATFRLTADLYKTIKRGGKLRFIIGQKGVSGTGSEEKGGGGGGGTAIYYQEPLNNDVDPIWRLVMVAGGGGGAVVESVTLGNEGHGGGGGRDTKTGGEGAGGGKGGTNGQGGGNGGGGGLYSGAKQFCWNGDCTNGNPGLQNGIPTGATGGTHKNDGGFGFGSGSGGEGSSSYRHGGGGGGYSGGGRGGNGGAGGGGGSHISTYYDAVYTRDVQITAGGTGSSPNHRDRYNGHQSGSVSFRFKTVNW